MAGTLQGSVRQARAIHSIGEGRRRAGRRFRANRLAIVGAAIIVAILLIAALGPILAPHDPIAGDLLERHQGPSRAHPLGTDFLGRDQLSRTLHGARRSVFAALGVLAAIVAIATVVGMVAGYLGGAIEALLMRLVDLTLAFPSLVLALAIAGLLGPGLRNALIALVLVGWADLARLIRGEVVALREREFITAARAVGGTPRWIIWRHILPNIASIVTILATLDAGAIILALASLSFLGLGAPPPAPEWGRMLFDAKPYLERQPLEMVVPGAAIAITVLGFNLLGDGLRDALDPSDGRG